MKKRKRKPITKRIVPAIPPDDYKGSVADWMIGLQEIGAWDGQTPEWHGDVRITPREYEQLLKKCES